MDEKYERNCRVSDRYDELMQIGKHGHYETMFQIVREEVERERNRCIGIVESYQVPVGNSAAGEMACNWTMDALRSIRDDMRSDICIR